MSINQQIKDIISHLILSQKNIDVWEEYEENIVRNFEFIDFRKVILDYKPCFFRDLYVKNYELADILYKNIVLNNNLFTELFGNCRYPRKERDFNNNDVWNFVEKCAKILVNKQICEN